MARYLGPREKIERRIGERIGLKGTRSNSPKSAVTRKPYPPGMHGQKSSRKPSEYGLQLKSKQKVKNMYRMLEKQFKSTIQRVVDSKQEPYGGIARALEGRLDNVVYRMGLAQSRDQARQLVNHGHILVNGRKVGIPSYTTKAGDAIGIREGSKTSPYFSAQVPTWFAEHQAPSWIQVDKTAMTATIKGQPSADESGVRPEDLQSIIELYSR